MTATITSRRTSLRLAGRVLALLAAWQPRPLSQTMMTRLLACNRGTLRGALERLVAMDAVAIHPQSRLVTLLDRDLKLDVPAEPVPVPPPVAVNPPEMDERLLHAAILRRAEACVRSGNLPGAVDLLNKAAERCRPEVAINFLVLGDLYGAGHRAYPIVPEAEAEALRKRSGFITVAEIDDALASAQ